MGRFFVIITEFYNIMDFTVATDFCTILAIISGENLSFCMLRTTSTVFSALPSTFLKQIFHIYHFLEEKHFYKKKIVSENFIVLIYICFSSRIFQIKKTPQREPFS